MKYSVAFAYPNAEYSLIDQTGHLAQDSKANRINPAFHVGEFEVLHFVTLALAHAMALSDGKGALIKITEAIT